MNTIKLEDMTVDQLVQRFVAIALEQDEAEMMGDTHKFSPLYWKMDAVKRELKARTGDQRMALVPLYNHSNAQVRLKAAIATLAVNRMEAQRTLRSISDREEYPQAIDARGMIRALDDGAFKPE